MKRIQDWLGHSDFSTTANIYAHLDYNSKLSSAQAMIDGLNFVTDAVADAGQAKTVLMPSDQEKGEKQVSSAQL